MFEFGIPIAQLAKGYHFTQKNSKYFFFSILHWDKKFKHVCFILIYIFQVETSFFQFPIFPELVLKNIENEKNASIPGTSFWFSVYLSTYSGKTEN